MNMKKLLALVSILAMHTLHAQEDKKFLDTPENIYWHKESNSWYVSNLGGGINLEKDGDGFITKLDANGNVVNEKWVTELDAPTGMSAVGNLLYVGDRGVVVVIDIQKGKVLRKIVLEGSEFVNDVATGPDGSVYISDTFTNRIYYLESGSDPEILIEDEELEYPNGLVVDKNSLIVATWGPMTDRATFATSRKGTLKKINLTTKELSPIGEGKPIANFDGVMKYKGYYYATDWVGGRLLKISKKGEVKEVIKGYTQLADLGIDIERGLIGMPEMSSNRVFFLKL
jgi:DNA-binding beta-propeller fold protein YncE